jgi:hypothetical protein
MPPPDPSSHRQSLPLPGWVARRLGWLFAAASLTAAAGVIADTPADRALAVAAQIQSQPPAIRLSWPAAADATEYRIARKAVEASSWGAEVILPGSATEYLDAAVVPGAGYEYAVYKIAPSYGAPGFICAGIGAPLVDDRGTILLIVDETHATALAAEIARLRLDLVGDGWTVRRRDVARAASPLRVKELIREAYRGDQKLRAVFLLGHVPVPYSGAFAPDAHTEHEGAWPADAFYGDLDGGWTDATADISIAADPRNHNVPGDGKFDQSVIPSDIELEVGRVDLAAMPSFANSEVELLRQYLDKDHAFRHRAFAVERRGLIVDEFGFSAGEAFAATAWGNFWSLFGAAAVAEEPWFPTLSSQSRLWAYACGPGTFSSAGSLDISQFASAESRAVFTGLFGSYMGDWDRSDSLLRAPLANAGAGLAAIWAGRPFWYLHAMGLGHTIGFCTRTTQNNLTLYPPNSAARGVHVALMGDPTLRLHPITPPSDLAAVRRGARVVDLAWTDSVEPVAGYHVYRGVDPAGPFKRVTESLIQGATFTDAAAPAGSIHMVRAVNLEETPTGTYWNASQGIFTAADLPRVSLSVKRAITSALGGSPAEMVFTRNGSDVAAIDVHYTVGGTATNGVHYQPLSGQLTIPAGFAAATLRIIPAPVTDSQPPRTVVVKLAPNAAYSAGASRSATVTIASEARAFAPYAGGFDDVTLPETPAAAPNLLSLRLGANGAFTATIRHGTEIFRVRGTLDDAGAYSGNVSGAADLLLSLALDFTTGSPALIGTLTRNGDVIANLTARRASTPAPGLVAPGLYTVALPAEPTQPGASVPEGAGWGLARIARNGRGRFLFTLGDRTHTSTSIAISENGGWPIFVPLYRSTGWLAGMAQFQQVAGSSDAAGNLSWSKPLPGGVCHPGAFDAQIALVACKYTPPGRGRRAFAFENVAGNAEWQAETGGLAAPLRKVITIDALNVAQPILPGLEKLKLRINNASGVVTGSFIHPGLGRIVTFSGAILQKPARAIGHFAAVDRTGTITVERNAQFPGLELGGLARTSLRPRVAIDLPFTGTRVNEPSPPGIGLGLGLSSGFNPTLKVTGHATHGQPIARIEYQLVQNEVVGTVQQAPGGADWEIPLFLGAENAGPLTVFVKAIDASGNESLLHSRSFTYVVVRNITVAVNSAAMGTVTDGFLGSTPRELGQSYTITATPEPGYRFTAWSGSITSTANPLVFKPSEFFFLQANFEPIP